MVLYGQHLPRSPRTPKSDKAEPFTTLERWAVHASEHPDWMPTMPDDAEEAEALAGFWRILQGLGDAVKVWRAEDAEMAG